MRFRNKMAVEMQPNPLDAFLSRPGAISERELARRVGVHYSRISRYRSGESIPMGDVALALSKKTGGKVPVSYWQALARARRGASQS